MYSPKINEELIPRLYRLRRLKKIPMTRLVNQMLSAVLPELEKREGISGPEAKVDDAIEPQVRDESRVYTGKHLYILKRRPKAQVLCMTHTRKAAEEMRGRIAKHEDTESINVSTIHSLC